MAKVDELGRMIADAENIVAFTGAGISTESGIPDFRSPGGIWTKYRPIKFGEFLASAEARRESWRRKFATHETMQRATPNAGHRALARLVEQDKMPAIVTQNIDGLHGEAGTRELIEVHGSIATSSCPACGAAYPLEVVRARLEAAADGVPRCDCGEPLKPDVVLFGEFLPEAALSRASQLASEADLLLCVGSSLEVYPVAGLPELTLSGGGALAIVTKGATPYDGAAEVKLDGDVVAELDAVLAVL